MILPLVLVAGGLLPGLGQAQTTAGVVTLHTFAGGEDETFPTSTLVQDAAGNFYGTTSGGTDFNGTVFLCTPDGTFTTLHRFGGADGQNPGEALILGKDGNFYGTTSAGGAANHGTVFKMTPTGTLTPLYSFTGGSDGDNPGSPLLQGSDGNFYGTTYQGGPAGAGTVFKLTPGGVLTTLYTFAGGTDGVSPRPGLIQDAAGNFYGTTAFGGSAHQGMVFRLTPTGTLTPLYSFTGGSDGGVPFAGLTQGSDGDFYGVTTQFPRGSGTVFRITAGGIFTTLHQFTGPDGVRPEGALVQGADGNFYGVNFGGGTSSDQPHSGTVFRISPDGSFATLHVFSGGTEGGSPQAALVQGRDGNFYGVTSQEAATNNGTIFELVFEPVITSAARTTTALGQPFSYSIKATNKPTSYAADPLPPGLMLDSVTGQISGTPTATGDFTVNVSATNAAGTATASLVITVMDSLPVVTLTLTTPSVVVGSGGKGMATVNLPAPLAVDLIVNFTIKGSAVNGTDYVLLKGTKKIKAGKTSNAIKIKPQGDLGGASKKTVKLTLTNGDGYVVGTTTPVKIKILGAN